MRLLTLSLAAAALAVAQQPSLIIPHIADGGGWKTTVAVYSFSNARVTVTFRASDGSKLTLPINNRGLVSSLDVDMAPSTSIYLETSGSQPDVRVGWVQVDQPEGHTPVKGFAIFRQSVAGRPDFEAVSIGMRGSDSITFPFDNTNGFATGFAIVNLGSSDCTVGAGPIHDEFGTALTAETRMTGAFPANGHGAFLITDKMPELANRRGYLVFNVQGGCGPQGIAMVGLRFSPSGPFTNLLPLRTAIPF